LTTRVCIDGQILPPEEARIPVFDRGFLYGDSVYEVLRTYQGVPFALEAHLLRLERSAAGLEIGLPPRDALLGWLRATLDAAGNPESYLRIMVTRGSGPMSLDPTTAEAPRSVILIKPFEPFPAWMYERGIAVAIPAIRRNARVALDPAIKSGNYLNNVLALGQARKAGFDDALLLDVNGRVTEGTSSNVFVVRGGQIHTPNLETGLLPGVTRKELIPLLKSMGLTVRECELGVDELLEADEIWLTSTLREIIPVRRVDKTIIGAGSPGPIYRRALAAFRGLVLERIKDRKDRG
jgi:branched-chain amino acid aminotransferase